MKPLKHWGEGVQSYWVVHDQYGRPHSRPYRSRKLAIQDRSWNDRVMESRSWATVEAEGWTVRKVAILENPLKRWMVFDPDGRPRGWPRGTKREAIEAETWSAPDSIAPTLWEDAKRQGWTVRKVTITEGWQ